MSKKDIDAKINVDVNSAIEKLAEKLGTTAKEIVTQYVIFMKVKAITGPVFGLFFCVVPWLTFLVIPESDGLKGYNSNSGEIMFMNIMTFIVCAMCTIGGISSILEGIEKYFASKAFAISKLLNDIK